jgi:hypothetical protein
MALLQIIDDYSKYQNITYDFIFYTRLDVLFTLPINIRKLEKILGQNSAAGKSTIFLPTVVHGLGGVIAYLQHLIKTFPA